MIAVGGALGAIARYEVALRIQQRVPAGFPWGTFIVNTSGCLLMGIIMTVLSERVIDNPQWRYLIPIGFIGAYTTFSTFTFEAFQATSEGAWLIGATYVFGSLAAGYIALWVGILIARAL
jgi:CrcB protein